jgi:hypothetical protein
MAAKKKRRTKKQKAATRRMIAARRKGNTLTRLRRRKAYNVRHYDAAPDFIDTKQRVHLSDKTERPMWLKYKV